MLQISHWCYHMLLLNITLHTLSNINLIGMVLGLFRYTEFDREYKFDRYCAGNNIWNNRNFV